jgi:hypothetical protein
MSPVARENQRDGGVVQKIAIHLLNDAKMSFAIAFFFAVVVLTLFSRSWQILIILYNHCLGLIVKKKEREIKNRACINNA